jgi:hypothetical protein
MMNRAGRGLLATVGGLVIVGGGAFAVQATAAPDAAPPATTAPDPRTGQLTQEIADLLVRMDAAEQAVDTIPTELPTIPPPPVRPSTVAPAPATSTASQPPAPSEPTPEPTSSSRHHDHDHDDGDDDGDRG